eukprot:Blabericola_migrator_1__2978@NODE_185_length_11802_cov_66_327567_g160_i0_p9_GENE_NODE_185_length_11802_cov_66_327567_g160_i0NODE_185_length_11802_cov_66_327567_g160_i0_p9_ORF_typecomplete_len155_score20_34_NODE_185_length_11802_cov_66_327567_g160_i011191583
MTRLLAVPVGRHGGNLPSLHFLIAAVASDLISPVGHTAAPEQSSDLDIPKSGESEVEPTEVEDHKDLVPAMMMAELSQCVKLAEALVEKRQNSRHLSPIELCLLDMQKIHVSLLGIDALVRVLPVVQRIIKKIIARVHRARMRSIVNVAAPAAA